MLGSGGEGVKQVGGAGVGPWPFVPREKSGTLTPGTHPGDYGRRGGRHRRRHADTILPPGGAA
jgi:hypothetical protein